MIDLDSLKKLATFDVYLHKNKTSDELITLRKVRFKELFFSKYSFNHESKDYDVIFFRSLNREDYKKYFDEIYNSLPPCSKLNVSDYDIKSDVFNIDALYYFFEYRLLISKGLGLSNNALSDCILFRLIKYFYIASEVVKIRFKSIVFFSDHQPVEFLISTLCRMKGRKTATLQHGLYVEYMGVDTVNKINYELHPSEYFLAWGENTKCLIEKHHPESNVVLCGKPEISINSDLNHSDEEYLTLIFDQPMFDSENTELLNIAHDFCKLKGLSLNLRCHPGKDFTKYDLNKINGVKILNDYNIFDSKVVIGHTSSLLYEVLSSGIPALRYTTKAPSLELPKQIEFSDLAGLIEIYELISLMRMDDFVLISRPFFDCFGDDSRSRYKGFFINLLSDIGAHDVSVFSDLVKKSTNDVAVIKHNWLVSNIILGYGLKPVVVVVGSRLCSELVKKQTNKSSFVRVYLNSNADFIKDFELSKVNSLNDYLYFMFSAADYILHDGCCDQYLDKITCGYKVLTQSHALKNRKVLVELVDLGFDVLECN